MAKPKLGSAKKASNQMTLMNLTAGKWVSQAIAVAAELGIPDLLKERPRTAAEIARTASASKDGVYRLLRALASVGLFAETGNRKFRLTPLGRLLCTDSSQALGGYARFVGDQSTWRPWFDLPHVTAGATALLESAGVADRCEIVSGDFFASVPEGSDAYIMKHIIHDWDDDRASEILQNCHHAMQRRGKVLIVDAVIPPGN